MALDFSERIQINLWWGPAHGNEIGERNWENLKKEIIFNCWCKTGLTDTSNSVLNNLELEASSKIKEIKTHLVYVMPAQFQSSITELLILDE